MTRQARHNTREANNGRLFKPRYFIVEGDGRFPLDCLRYDQCWPFEEKDSNAIHAAHDDHDHPRRAICLMTYSPSAPHDAKWIAYGWTVTIADRALHAAPSKLSEQRLEGVPA